MNEVFVKKPLDGEPWDVVIVGSGPAGLTAAIYTTRGASSTMLFAGEKWGGQLMLTTEVDNYPGFAEGIEGPGLIAAMRKQAERFGTEIIEKNVASINFNASPFEIKVKDEIYKSKSIILAFGAETNWLGVPGELELIGRGVSSCAPCDAPFFRDKKVAVVGGGDSAMEEALVLAKFASEVTIIHRRDSFRASAAMQQKVLNNSKIKITYNTQVTQIHGSSKLEKITIENVETNKSEELFVDGIFVAIGHSPNTSVVKGQIDLDEKGYILKDKDNKYGFKMATNVEGVFVAGDVHDHHYKQAITAAGFGCMAALETLSYLDRQRSS